MSGSITIIGAGIAGLAAGCYARMNGYRARIYEMHTLPGGLCTAWRRQGYLIDGCIRWLCGSGPGMGLHQFWEELGAMEDLTYYNHRASIHLELPGLNFTLYNDADELEAYLLEMAPEDREWICELADGIRQFAIYGDPYKPEAATPEAAAYVNKWTSITMDQLVAQVKNPGLRQALSILWSGAYPAYYGFLQLGYGNAKSGGVPLGGSLEFARAIEHRFLELGGEIHYNARVKRILVEDDRAVGLELADGTQVWEREGDIISAADAHLTIFDLLDGRYVDDPIRAWFDQVPVIQAPLQITVGVGLPLEDAPAGTGGILFPPAEPVVLYGEPIRLMNAALFNFDPAFAPSGKTVIQTSFWGNYDYWKKLHETPEAYQAEKERISREVIRALDCRFPGLAEHVEMVDVATPLTTERYTGNWQGSSQGWLPTGQASTWLQEAQQEGRWPASMTLPGLDHFYMVGQWLVPFGGLPTAAQTGRSLVELLCKRDGVEFAATKPE